MTIKNPNPLARHQHAALYGNSMLLRGYCTSCNQYGFIQDGEIACCGALVDISADKVRRLVQTEGRRSTPSATVKKHILAVQGNACLYCDLPLNSVVYRKHKAIKLRVNWDHVLPFSYSQDSGDVNFAATCHICNGIKSNKIFKTLEEARALIQKSRDKKGYSVESNDGY